MRLTCCYVFLLLLASAPAAARGQTRDGGRRFEVGALVTTVDARGSTGERPLGVGGRFTYHLDESIAFDSVVSHFPADPAGNFGQTQGLFGVKFGKRFAHVPVGVFTKLRPGFVSLDDAFVARSPGGKTKFAADVGGVFEFYPSPRTVIRYDAGQTIIRFGDTIFTPPAGEPRRLGTTRSFQTSVSVGYRF